MATSYLGENNSQRDNGRTNTGKMAAVFLTPLTNHDIVILAGIESGLPARESPEPC